MAPNGYGSRMEPGWYPSPERPGMTQWFDGTGWAPRWLPPPRERNPQWVKAKRAGIVALKIVAVVVFLLLISNWIG